MKHDQFSQNQNKKPSGAASAANAAELEKNRADFSPSADEVARRAYFSYVNEGSQPGRDVQHWLQAEAQLLVERDITRVHGFHNHT